LRLLILNQFYYPDHSATSQLMTDLAESLVEGGVEVSALAGRGRYNGGAGLPRREEHRGVHIERAWTTGLGKGSAIARLVDYLSFYVGASWKLISLPRHEIVMVLTTPPLIGLPAMIVCRLRGIKLVSLVQDIYPDVAVALGALNKRSALTRILDRLNTLVLKQSERIIVLGDCMRQRIAAKVGATLAQRIDVIHNWADGERIAHRSEEGVNPFVKQHELSGRFVVLFSGNLGRVNEFSTLLRAAELLRDRPDILFMFIGEGARSEEISSFAKQRGLGNLRLLPYQSRDQLQFSLAAGNVHLVTLAEGLAGLSVPSKTYGVLAAGRPVLFVGDRNSATAKLVEEGGCGAVVPAGDVEQLAALIKRWADDAEVVKSMGRAARQLFEEKYDRPHAVKAYMESFRRCMGEAGDVAGAG
jgi:colanic acid biosynthesis glycosyl transferase WcaI